MQVRLDGRCALITGGSRGLGRAIAQRFLESGADVAVLALEEFSSYSALLSGRDPSRRAIGFACDISRSNELERGFRDAADALGRIDIIVNNAGIHTVGPFDSIGDDTWQQDFDLKLMAAIRLSRLAWPQMKDRRWGRILNVLSVAARMPKAGSAPSSVIRTAGLSLTKVLAGEGAPYNILVNAMLAGYFATQPEDDPTGPMAREIPLGRMGRPEEFANLACFLASDAASYITGAAIDIDGGRCPAI